MKFVCNDCQDVMEFVDNTPSDDGGSLNISYACPTCNRGISMVTNPGETQMVNSLGVTIGHEALGNSSPAPMSMIQNALAGSAPVAAASAAPEPVWTEAAQKRLAAAPGFVQGMVRRLYTDYAQQKGYTEITPAIMSEAREALGMMGM
ncbi:PCP reductase family protein [Chloroflexi bacterium TSY]|nr:PCP reductase family protein [Chloroflexi bacterium TSY]